MEQRNQIKFNNIKCLILNINIKKPHSVGLQTLQNNEE